MLAVQDLSVEFCRYKGFTRQRGVVCLENICLEMSRGEILAVIGASGSGKSLLVHAMLGLVPGNATIGGRVAMDGKVLDLSARRALCGNRLALVPQSISYLDPLVRSGRQMFWAAGRAGCGDHEIPGVVKASMDRFNLNAWAARAYPHQLSGGMARRVLLAIASAGRADAVLADEPTSALDENNAQAVLVHLRRIADEGKAVMLVTHDLCAALPFADRVAIIRDGRLAAIEPACAFSGDGGELRSSYAKALWNALPQNGFATTGGVLARSA